ncbi:hypothetical protein N658DRAFT_95983 [Parathielavia hyrcaniae]|uniref:Uncharacterized protein n=1 Tax=Parathielavia hyrcaniae TaxID=113614 RepID=A0AAN6T0P1_9PEZI|nr:hypothetical protein N658DRAFT_95983 [Parathielavia hyrcaniae]
MKRGPRRGHSRTATGVRPTSSGNNSWFGCPITTSPKAGTVIHMHPVSLPGGSPKAWLGTLSSLPIGHATARRSTSLYTPTPLPRVRKDCRLGVISAPRPPSLLSPVFPSRKWTLHKSTLPNSTQLPRPLSTLAPQSPDLDQSRKHLRTMKDPVARIDSPYTDPSVKGPRSQILSRGRPVTANMISNSVNKTGLHPSGITPHPEHTELEEELHEKAHIDYDRVAIVSPLRCLVVSTLN